MHFCYIQSNSKFFGIHRVKYKWISVFFEDQLAKNNLVQNTNKS
uniref:Uncharacterized protein n=1 Tax=Arundo donax TaxID=35708 RepID=A0A0A9AF36_ARUDO